MAAGAVIVVLVGVVSRGPGLLLLLHGFLCSFSGKCTFVWAAVRKGEQREKRSKSGRHRDQEHKGKEEGRMNKEQKRKTKRR